MILFLFMCPFDYLLFTKCEMYSLRWILDGESAFNLIAYNIIKVISETTNSLQLNISSINGYVIPGNIGY